MKYLPLVFFSVISIFCFSQDEKLFQNNWQLTKLTVGDNSYYNPKTSEAGPVSISFLERNSGNFLSTSVCDSKECRLSFDDQNSEFTILSCSTTLGGCSLFGDPNEIEFVYFDFFSEGSTFDYLLETNANAINLTIVKPNGDKAYYVEPQPVERIGKGSWYLDKLRIGSEIIENPLNSSGNIVTTDFGFNSTSQNDSFSFYVCEHTEGNISYLNEESAIFSISNMSTSQDDCNVDPSVDADDVYNFENKLLNFYNKDGIYSYVIIEDSPDKPIRLIIASPDFSERVFYTRAVLSNKTFKNDTVTIFPNPVKQNITVSLNDTSSSYTLKIYNTLGKIEFSKAQMYSETINLEHLYPGVYFLNIEDSFGNIVTKKIVKI